MGYVPNERYVRGYGHERQRPPRRRPRVPGLAAARGSGSDAASDAAHATAATAVRSPASATSTPASATSTPASATSTPTSASAARRPAADRLRRPDAAADRASGAHAGDG